MVAEDKGHEELGASTWWWVDKEYEQSGSTEVVVSRQRE